jgi:long-chain acyl-CoA synthetase
MDELLTDLPESVSALATRWAKIAPDHPALVDGTGTWRYGELPDVVDAARNWLVQNGVRRGDRVMIVGENCRALVILLLASASLDAWSVIVNARLSDREIDQIRDHCRPRRILYSIGVSARAQAHAERHGAIAAGIDPNGSVAVGSLSDTAVPESISDNTGERIAAVIYTTGTTGRPKGVMLTHRNLLYVAKISGALRALGHDDHVYGLLPISHILGLSVVLLGSLYYGATLHLAARFDPARVLMAIYRDRLSFILGTPAMYTLLAEYAELKGLERVGGHSLRVISAAGAPLDPATKAAAERLFGITLHNGYGITECSPTIAQTRLDRPRRDCSVGPIWPGVEVELVDASGKPVSAGDVGELRVRGPNLMAGYYRAPDETAAAINAEGWFSTGDLARFEDDHLFIVGRAKELIIRHGFNVYPAEVELVLNTHPGVTQSAVIGRLHDGIEDIIAFVQPRPGVAITPAQLADHAARQLASYKRPTEIIVLPKLPAAANGKVLKSDLVRLAEEGYAREPQPDHTALASQVRVIA